MPKSKTSPKRKTASKPKAKTVAKSKAKPKAKAKPKPKAKPIANAVVAGPSRKQHFLNTFARETATTLRVLRSLPHHHAEFNPGEKTRSARVLAWTFAIENSLANAAVRGEWKWPPEFPPAPATYAEVVDAYDKGTHDLMTALAAAPESVMGDTVTFFTGPKQMGPIPISDFLWFMLMDSVHHRGQFSIYLRMCGAPVPSIYGPSADEPW